MRNMIFPRVSELVPTATRQGAEAFLKSIHRAREVFEYEASDPGESGIALDGLHERQAKLSTGSGAIQQGRDEKLSGG